MSIYDDIDAAIATLETTKDLLEGSESALLRLGKKVVMLAKENAHLRYELAQCQEPPVPPFVPGETEPFWDVESDSGNVGAKGDLLEYPGSPNSSGVFILQDGATYENMYFPGVVELRKGEQLINCEVDVPPTYTAADSIKACVRILNGSENVGASLMKVTIRNRSQRVMNGLSGRNAKIRETVVLGCVDAFNVSQSGDAPQISGLDLADSIQPDFAWWYAPTTGTEVHNSDTQVHADGYQHGVALASVLDNMVLLGYVGDSIGTGTPGSGSDAGNAYVQPYISTQSQMEQWREQHVTIQTDPSQSKYGVSHWLPDGGSVAAIMVNRDHLTVHNSQLAGSFATVNMMDNNLPTNMDVTLVDNVFWNDMKNGHTAGDPADKGDAILIKKGKTAHLSGNVWSDGTPVTPSYA